jgi:hypothetical protein
MTSTPPPTSLAGRVAAAFRSITLPQSLVVVALIAGAVVLALELPDDRWGGLMRIAVLALGGGGAVGTLFLNGRSSTSGSSTSEPPPPPSAPPPGRHRSGHVLVDVLLGVVVVAGTLLLAALHSGCGASALQTQARAATVATVALEVAHRATMEETERRLEACGDVACTQDVERSMAPIALAYEAARVSLVGWVEALQVAAVAGDDGDVIAALLTAGARWLALWDPLAAALAGVGVEVPRLPPLVTGLLGGGR